MSAVQLLTEHLALWSSADTEKKSGRGRASGNAASVYGIKKLRELILELAVRGKLVPQDASDEPASELLKRIEVEKAKLIAEGKIKKSKPLPEFNDNEKPFELPNGWEWVRLSDISLKITDGEHISPKKTSSGMPLLSAKDVTDQGVVLSSPQYVSVEDGVSFRSRCDPEMGDALICSRGTIGRCAAVETDDVFCLMGSVILIKNSKNLFYKYIIRYLQSSIAQKWMYGASSATAVSALYLKDVAKCLIPIPSLAEQHRIVAKVDELMALCDQLENQHTDAIAAHEKLVIYLLATLTQSKDAADFNENWQRIEANFDVLFSTESSIDALKQTLLQLAVMGKLVPQDASDEPASELLKRIQVEKAKLISEGKIKKSKPLADVSDEEKSLVLPKGWVWTRWDTIALKIGDIDHKMPEQVTEGYPYVSPRDFYPNNRIDFDGAKKISKSDFLVLSAKIQPKRGDIIYPRYGTIGENRLVETDVDFLASYSCAVIKTMHDFISPEYQFIYSVSNFVKNQAKAAENKTTQANVGIKSIQNYVYPLPPLPEQYRIVAKVDELLKLCDTLKSRISVANQIQRKVADVMVEQAVA